MKKIVSICVVAVVTVSAMLVLKANANKSMFNGNIEALASEESYPANYCYTNSYSISDSYVYEQFCDENTSGSTIYSCPPFKYGRKGSMDRCIKDN